MKTPLIQRCLAEFLGTFFLLIIGCGVVVVGGQADALTHEGIAITWGLIVMVLIYAIGDVSGCHINPAVTIAFTAAGRFPIRESVPYVASQYAGATAGAAALWAVFGSESTSLGATRIAESLALTGGFAVEAMMTLILMFVVMGVSTGAKEKSITAGLAVGAVIGMEAMAAGPITGASMNPARTFGPALVSGDLSQVPIYTAATILGALSGMLLYQSLVVGVKKDARNEDAGDEVA